MTGLPLMGDVDVRNADRERSFRGANVSSVAVHNRKTVLNGIRARAVVKRLELSAITGLTHTTVANLVKKLMADGLVLSTRMNEGLRGQPANALRLNPDAAFTLGLNVDRDHVTLVILDFLGEVRTRFHCPAAFARPAEARVFLADCIDRLRRQGDIPLSRVSGIGLAIPEELSTTQLIGQPDSYREWNHIRPVEFFGGLLDVPVVRENDAASAAISEMLYGAGRELDSFFYVFIGAGLGGGLVINRRYVRGANGRSGEIGFLPQAGRAGDRQPNLQRTLGDEVLTATLIADLHAQGFTEASMRTLEQFVDRAPEIVDGWVCHVADHLHRPLLGVMAMINPDAIVIGGLPRRITEALSLRLGERMTMPAQMQWLKPVFRAAAVAADSAAIGAATLASKGAWEPEIYQRA